MLNQPHRPGSQPLGIPQDIDPFSLQMEGADGAMALPEVMPPAPKGNQTWRWLLISLISCGLTTGAAVGAFVWLVNLPPVANCDNTASITSDRAELYCAQIAAESGQLDDVLASLDLIAAWETGHPLYYEVQPLVDQWSRVALQAANQQLQAGQLEDARALVGHIPAHSTVYDQAQAVLDSWNAEWETGEAIVATAQEALQVKDWGKASQQVQALSDLRNPYWRGEQVQTLSRQIRQERQAQTLLDQAIAQAAPGGADRLGGALRTASQIDQATYAWTHAQPYLNRWSDLLLTLALDKWYGADLATATQLGRQAALNPQRAKVAQEMIWLSESRQQAQTSLSTWRGAPDQLIKLYQAMMVANQIPADSPYYGQAKSNVDTWQTYLGDLAQLQLAQAIGQVRTLDTVKLAITQAQKVPIGHPRRVEAQTMIAHWRQEMERIEDRPYLVKAHQLAQAETIGGLQAAIQSANGVALHRALRGEAQSWIYVWTNKIQAIEDRPTLNQAKAMADRGELTQAIATASTVASGRALYSEAQAAIAGWQQQIFAQEQARQRALQRAAQTPEPTTSETPDDALEAQERLAAELETDAVPLPNQAPTMPSAGPRTTPRGRSTPPLPRRIETVPGPAPKPAAPAPSPAVVTPPAPLTPPAAETPSAPAPVPIAPPPPSLSAPTIPAPAPIDVAPPTLDQGQPPDGDEPQAGLSRRSPLAVVPPQPEHPARPSLTKSAANHAPSHTDILYTGALYVGY
ncbi:MAG: hypothetical protein EA342_15620 [Leptolyngbya sp. LCM1.Bin17]|nr:MAG: hypothetical protein EA342_15620 [Leptolyngbya sp. LCM1.Bin17]